MQDDLKNGQPAPRGPTKKTASWVQCGSREGQQTDGWMHGLRSRQADSTCSHGCEAGLPAKRGRRQGLAPSSGDPGGKVVAARGHGPPTNKSQGNMDGWGRGWKGAYVRAGVARLFIVAWWGGWMFGSGGTSLELTRNKNPVLPKWGASPPWRSVLLQKWACGRMWYPVPARHGAHPRRGRLPHGPHSGARGWHEIRSPDPFVDDGQWIQTTRFGEARHPGPLGPAGVDTERDELDGLMANLGEDWAPAWQRWSTPRWNLKGGDLGLNVELIPPILISLVKKLTAIRRHGRMITPSSSSSSARWRLAGGMTWTSRWQWAKRKVGRPWNGTSS